MKNVFFSVSVFIALLLFDSCKDSTQNKLPPAAKNEALSVEKALKDHVKTIEKKQPSDFVPKGFVIFDKIEGNLNNDGHKDYVLIIKGTEKDKIITHEYRGKLDRNRRGIIVLFKTEDGSYNKIVENKSCFSSENEDGGVYYAPEMDVSIDKNNLYINYMHGRYGYWTYTFKYRNNDFQLIGYDSSYNRGPIVQNETSINFLTGKKQFKDNINKDSEEDGDEVFKETWSTIDNRKPVLLSEIKDFDRLDF
ncbi:hypothetical protein [Chryseobacterium sp. POE27]|uniref:hypothetical protein n=1 Tax=Chryseobacterium sp. POE27 TaxID=3138177 RepID=UPI0032198731